METLLSEEVLTVRERLAAKLRDMHAFSVQEYACGTASESTSRTPTRLAGPHCLQQGDTGCVTWIKQLSNMGLPASVLEELIRQIVGLCSAR